MTPISIFPVICLKVGHTQQQNLAANQIVTIIATIAMRAPMVTPRSSQPILVSQMDFQVPKDLS